MTAVFMERPWPIHLLRHDEGAAYRKSMAQMRCAMAFFPRRALGALHDTPTPLSGSLGFLMRPVSLRRAGVALSRAAGVGARLSRAAIPATVALAEAIADPPPVHERLRFLDTVPTLPRGRLISSYGALMAPSGR
jgi:hypothetical protein